MKQFEVSLVFLYDEEPNLIETEEDAIQQAINELENNSISGFEFGVRVIN